MFAVQLLKDFISLFYPEVCLCCGEGLGDQEKFICTICLYKLPKTNFHLHEENELKKVFWGRAEINSAAALGYFEKGNAIQTLVHELKYRNKKELGTYLGKYYGQELKKSALYQKCDTVIPVPLHRNKLKRRGYNQSALFGRGIAESLGIKEDEDLLVRNSDTATQTRKSRMSRWQNVHGIFEVTKKESLKDMNILLVDDVITTGATLEACACALNEAGAASVSIASIGYAAK